MNPYIFICNVCDCASFLHKAYSVLSSLATLLWLWEWRQDLVVALGALPLVIVLEGDLVEGAEAWVAVVRRGRVEMGAAGEDLRGGIREESRGYASPGGTFVKCAPLLYMRAHQ